MEDTKIRGAAQVPPPSATHCTRCGELLKGRVVWLSLNSRTGRYTVEPVANPEDDQGGHPFGLACSRRALKEGR
jgi:hypothetical protein